MRNWRGCSSSTDALVARLLGMAIATGSLLLAGCASVRAPSASAPKHPIPTDSSITFILVPHAETATDAADPDDPPLSAQGLARARALGGRLSALALTAVYVDEFRRTQATAAAVMEGQDAPPLSRYFSRGPLAESAQQWRTQHSRGTVLVVAEPETLAPLGNSLCDCTITPLRAGEADRLIRIQRKADGSVLVDEGIGHPRP